MDGTHEQASTALQAVSSAMVKLHKEQFGRGPTHARADFAGADAVVCVLHNALLPAELRMVGMGAADRVRDSRVAFQAATASEFVGAVEQILDRKVRAFASGIDPESNVVFETFLLEPRASNGDGYGQISENLGEGGVATGH